MSLNLIAEGGSGQMRPSQLREESVRLSVSRESKLKSIFSSGFLLKILIPTALRLNEREFSLFHLDQINTTFPELDVGDIICVTECFNAGKVAVDVTPHGGSDRETEIIRIYNEDPFLDFTAKGRFIQPGRLFHSNDCSARPEFESSEFYSTFLKPFDVWDAFAINYLVPGNSGIRLSMSFLGLKQGQPLLVDRHSFEYFNIPFFLAWLFKLNLIGEREMRRWLSLLSSLTPMQVALLREIVGAIQYSPDFIASKFSISKRTIETHLYQIYGHVFNELSLEAINGKRASRLVDICNHYEFLRLCAPINGHSPGIKLSQN